MTFATAYPRPWMGLRAWVRLRRPARDGLSVVGVIALALLVLNPWAHGADAYAYWSFDPADPYALARGRLDNPGAFLYSPPIALIFLPAHALSWPVFATGWTLLVAAAAVWLGGAWGLALLATYPVLLEVSYGNVSLLLAVAIVVGFRWPASWAFVLLTKVTPGIALFWFVFRREWKHLATAVGATAVISLFSALVAPDMWRLWLNLLAESATLPDPGAFGFVPRWLRFVAALFVVAWGAATNRRWTVPVSAGLASPVAWLFAPVMLGVLPLIRAAPPGTGDEPDPTGQTTRAH